jgi:exosortase/archaeosortase family protein
MAVFGVFFFAYFTETAFFESYLELNARVSGDILRWLGEDVRVARASISAPGVALTIRHGCDAIFPSALFLAAVIASPVPFKSKLPGMFLGSVVLLSINLIRIISLYYVQLHIPTWFHAMHVDIWQPAFIFLALFFWILWAVRATRGGVVAESASSVEGGVGEGNVEAGRNDV